MDKKETYKLISVISDNCLINIEELKDEKAAINRYFELEDFNSDEAGIKHFIFLVKGVIIKKNINKEGEL